MIGTKAAAEILGLSQDYVAKLCREGVFPSAEHDGKGSPWRIAEKEIIEYKKKGKNKK